MKLYTKNGEEIIAVNCEKPKLSPRRGSSWDESHSTIDGQNVTYWLDTTWGFYFYFNWNGKNYKISLHDMKCNDYVLPLTTKRVRVNT